MPNLDCKCIINYYYNIIIIIIIIIIITIIIILVLVLLSFAVISHIHDTQCSVTAGGD